MPAPTLPSPTYTKSLLSSDPLPSTPAITTTISTLSLQPHPEGGLFVETDRDPRLVANPFVDNSKSTKDSTRHASTTIHYLLTPSSPLGRFHRNKARTVHTLHWGRGVYVILHPPDLTDSNADSGDRGEGQGKWKLEIFTVGTDVENGERVQWIVEGGRYKASYLLSDQALDSEFGTEGRGSGSGSGSGSAKGLLISETVVPGFEFSDHDFLTAEGFLNIVEGDSVEELGWLLGKEQGNRLKSSNV